MCFDDDSHPPIPVSDRGAVTGRDITLRPSDTAVTRAYVADADGAPRAQVVILPDVRGLHNFYRELACRFAENGTRALALDYFGRTAPDDVRDESFDYGPHVVAMSPETFTFDLKAAIDYLRADAHGSIPTFTVGFCMGGSLSFYAATLGLDLSGVVGFYAGLNRARGAVTPAVEFGNRIASPLLGLFGGADEGIPESVRDEFDQVLDTAGVEHEIVVYPGAPHSFFDRKAADFAVESADAWSRVQGFIADHQAVTV